MAASRCLREMQKVILLSAPGLGDSLWMVLAFLGESRSPSSRCMARLRDALRRSALSPVPALLYKEESSILWPFSTILQISPVFTLDMCP